MDRIRTKKPGDTCPVEFAPAGPEGRGELGRMRMRSANGNGQPALVDVWRQRCPWCRDLIEIPGVHIFVDAGKVSIDDLIVCPSCESFYMVDNGLATKLGIE